jgi:hypothetical protein
VFRLFHIREAPTGFYQPCRKEQNQQAVPDGFQSTVDVRHHAPDRTALEILRALRQQCPDLSQLVAPGLQGRI